MFRVDLHVHTQRHSPCAESLNPEKLIIQARRQQLSGVVITEHDQLWSNEEIDLLQPQSGDVRFYRGVEVSSASGHFVVIGLDDLSGIQKGISIEDLIAIVKPQGAALILVHHHLVYSNIRSPRAVWDMPKGIDAIEVASSVTFAKNRAEAENVADLKGWTAVAGSDAHSLEKVGAAFTIFQRLPPNEKELARAIQAGECSLGTRTL